MCSAAIKLHHHRLCHRRNHSCLGIDAGKRFNGAQGVPNGNNLELDAVDNLATQNTRANETRQHRPPETTLTESATP